MLDREQHLQGELMVRIDKDRVDGKDRVDDKDRVDGKDRAGCKN